MSTVTVNSTTALLSALTHAHGGDVIQLAAGNYSGVNLSNLNFSTPVTVTSMTGAQVTFGGLKVTGSSGLSFSHIAINGAGTTDTFAARVASSSNISFDHMSIHGSLDGNPGDDRAGLYINGSTKVSVTNSEFQQFNSSAIAELNNNGVTISNNYIHDIVTDGIDNGGSSNVTISGNTITNFHPSLSGAHPDAIQFWTTNTTASASNILISNNKISAGTGGQTQGVFMGDEAGHRYQNVTITGNTITGELANGIAVYDANNLAVRSNIITSNKAPTPGLNSSSSGYSTVSGINLYHDSTVDLASNNAGSYNLSGNTGLTQSQVNYLSGVAQTATMYSSVSTTLGILSKTLILTGTASINGAANNFGSTVIANNAGDRLYDGAGNDTLVGGSGNDALVSRTGNDTLTGHAGWNTFQIGAGIGHAVITDFELAGAHNSLNISAFLSSGHAARVADVGGNAVVSFSGSSDTITLLGAHAADLTATSFGYTH